MDNKKEIIKFFLNKNILINKDIIDKLDSNNINVEEFYNSIKNQIKFYLRRFPRLIENIKTFFGKDTWGLSFFKSKKV